MSKKKYTRKNTLNDLTGAEWKYNSRSVINNNYPINLQHKLRSEHGGQKPPELCADLIKIFTKAGDVVLDPFMGVGGTLIGASLIERRSVGIDINQKWINIYKEVVALEELSMGETFCGDSLKVLESFEDKSFDFILTDVPYWNMDSIKKTRNKKVVQSKLNNFSNKPTFSSKEDWLNNMTEILLLSAKKLKYKKYMAVFIGDMYRNSEYHSLSSELALSLSKAEGLKMKANIIWHDPSKSLHIFGYPTAFVPSMLHQNILIFRKED